jgi:hypothetical protein
LEIHGREDLSATCGISRIETGDNTEKRKQLHSSSAFLWGRDRSVAIFYRTSTTTSKPHKRPRISSDFVINYLYQSAHLFDYVNEILHIVGPCHLWLHRVPTFGIRIISSKEYKAFENDNKPIRESSIARGRPEN